MTDKKIDFALGSVFVIMSFVALVLVDGVLVWRLLHLNKAKDRRGLVQAKDTDAGELGAAGTRALREPGEPVPSVTEQPTRALEPSYREDKRR